MLNSDHKPIARDASSSKENEKPVQRTEEKISLFPQSQLSSNMEPENFLEVRKRGKMSSATTVSTMAQS